MKKLILAEQLAARLCLDKQTVRRLAREDRLPCYRERHALVQERDQFMGSKNEASAIGSPYKATRQRHTIGAN